MYRAAKEATQLGRNLSRRKHLIAERRRQLAISPKAVPARTPRKSGRTPNVTQRLIDLWRRAYANSQSRKDKTYYKNLLAKHGLSVK